MAELIDALQTVAEYAADLACLPTGQPGVTHSTTVKLWCAAQVVRETNRVRKSEAVGQAIITHLGSSFDGLSAAELALLGDVARRAVEAENESETKG